MNIGNLDRIIRVIIGAVLTYLAYAGILGSWAYIGLIPLFTGLIGWCPLYTLLGVQTRGLAEDVKPQSQR
ncbi:YgaP family membrane protein [Galenea microaerophila]